MNIIVVDDETAALQVFIREWRKLSMEASITCFESALEAVEYARGNTVDVAFLDIQMHEMNGLFLAKQLKEVHGKTNIIFTTGYSSYTINAFDVRASGYLLKPISSERIKDELDNLRNPVYAPNAGVHVQCFGNFDIFVDGMPVSFTRSKSKEALAYLVDRKGAGVNKKELAAVLLGNKPYTRSMQTYTHTILAEMMRALKRAGAKDMVIKKQNHYAVDASKFSCDYYNYEKGDATAVNNYHGEYMNNFEWAEFTAADLSMAKEI